MPRRRPIPALIKTHKPFDKLVRMYGDPYEAMVRILNEEFPAPTDTDGQPLWEEIKFLLPGRELYRRADGRLMMRTNISLRFQIAAEAAQYTRPKLRGQEIRGEVDHNINVVIQTFGGEPAAKVIDVTPALPALEEKVESAG